MVTEAMKKKINAAVKKGYTQAAFRTKSNAAYFRKQWQEKGYKPGGTLRSSGPVLEGGHQKNAYYVVMDKKKTATKPKKRKVSPERARERSLNRAFGF